jgi:hypothetical protein
LTASALELIFHTGAPSFGRAADCGRSSEELLDWIGDGLRSQTLNFPERNGPIPWPRFSLGQALRSIQASHMPESTESLIE